MLKLNCDFAEGFGPYEFGQDIALAPYVQSINIACGVAGGDPARIARAIDLAARYGLEIGVHPSLPDREGFGRRDLGLTATALRETLVWQIGAVKGFADLAGLSLRHLKPHGLLNSLAARDASVAETLCTVARGFGLALVGHPASLLGQAAQAAGLPYLREFFIDIDYDEAGNMAADKTRPVDPAWVAERLIRAAREGLLRSKAGTDIAFGFDLACLHTDMLNPTEVAQAARQALAFLQES